MAFGIPILLFPKFLYGMFGIDLSGAGVTFPAQQYGASLFGNFLLAWLGRNLEQSSGRKAITWALFIYDAIAFVATLLLALTGTVSPLIWAIVVLYLVLALGFGYFLLKPTAE